ncbi:HIT family hydrolase, diadenosine tetraphosphate hydrolase [Rheinheimera sp. A13L]|uniref:HIT family protein n=1 Tax=Rheinheimera sp. A13L TaxID=506534 RepID=UPI0002124B93|nr:HIT family protein [Rheinheimera sp. A13L]EGM79032.1 HIT family hydrolase, diadenosine tetraphosphate hydrolase [Rheinheimera sp. A13L]
MSCIFCDIVAGRSPCHKVWEDDEHLAFLSIYPNTAGFTVVIPKKHYPSYIFAQKDEVVSKLTLASKKVALLLDKALDGVARTGMAYEGYEVDHLHSKLIPMHGTGNDSNFQAIDGTKGPFLRRYEGFLSTHDCERANDSELEKLAAYIRSCA